MSSVLLSERSSISSSIVLTVARRHCVCAYIFGLDVSGWALFATSRDVLCGAIGTTLIRQACSAIDVDQVARTVVEDVANTTLALAPGLRIGMAPDGNRDTALDIDVIKGLALETVPGELDGGVVVALLAGIKARGRGRDHELGAAGCATGIESRRARFNGAVERSGLCRIITIFGSPVTTDVYEIRVLVDKGYPGPAIVGRSRVGLAQGQRDYGDGRGELHGGGIKRERSESVREYCNWKVGGIVLVFEAIGRPVWFRYWQTIRGQILDGT